jgi:S1-C subfamily serine protease
VVSAIDGTSVSTMLEFYQELPQSGETTEITILRDGETETVTLERE